MIILRRIIAIPFFVAFFSMLMGLFFFSTIYRMKSPDVYAKQIQQVGTYDYIAKELAVMVMHKMEKNEQNAAIQGFIQSVFSETFSTAWIQKMIEDDLMKPFWPYLYGSVDHYTISIPIKDRVIVLLKSMKNKVLDGENSQKFYPTLISAMSTEIVNKASAEERSGLRFFCRENETTQQAVARLIQTAYPENELRTMLDSNLEKLIDFINKQNNERCTLSFDFSQPISNILQEIQNSLSDPQASKKIIQKLFIPAMAQEQYPFDIQIQMQDADFILQKMSVEWLKKENAKIFGHLQDYFHNKSEGFSIDLKNYKTRIINTFSALMEKKLREKWLSLPEGKPEQTEELMQKIYQGILPSHRPYAMSFEKMLAETGLDIAQVIDNSVNTNGKWKTTFTHRDLQQNIPQNISEFVHWENNQPLKVLKIDITNMVDSNQMDKILNQHQLTFTEKDLNNAEDMEKIRSFLKTLPIVILICLAVATVILLVATNLCAKEPNHRTLWFLSLAIAASMLTIMVTKTFDNTVWPQIMEKIEQQQQRVNNPVEKTGEEVGKRFLIALKDTFTTSMRLFSMMIIVVAVLLIFTRPIFKALLASNEQQTFTETNDNLKS